MEKRSGIPRSRGILFILVVVFVLFVVQPANAGENEKHTAPAAATSSATVTALARQIAFVKSFSAAYPYQYGQKTQDRKTGNGHENNKKNRKK